MSDQTSSTEWKFGIMQSVLEQSGPEAIRTAGQIGFTGVELGVSGPNADDHSVWTDDGRTELLKIAESVEVEFPSIALNFLNSGNVTDANASIREHATESIRRAIFAAADIGASVVLVPFFGDSEIRTQTHRDRIVENLGSIADEAENNDITLALENTLSAEENRAILRAIDSSAVGVYYDVSNATWWGHDPKTEIPVLDEQIAQIHFKDGDGGHSNAHLGTGHVDYEAVQEAIRRINYEGWIVLETTIQTDPETDAAHNLDFARELLSE